MNGLGGGFDEYRGLMLFRDPPESMEQYRLKWLSRRDPTLTIIEEPVGPISAVENLRAPVLHKRHSLVFVGVWAQHRLAIGFWCTPLDSQKPESVMAAMFDNWEAVLEMRRATSNRGVPFVWAGMEDRYRQIRADK